MKKLLTAALVVSMLILPVNSAAPDRYEEAPASQQTQDYLPGDVPAQTDAAESMSPAIHGLLLAMLNHGVDSFDFGDRALAWEGLYNMLSLYGQLDSRCDDTNGELLLPEETVRDYAAALAVGPDAWGTLPAGLRDRINYDAASQSYVFVCGEDGLAQVRVDRTDIVKDGLLLTGSLIYEEDEQTLIRFQAALQPKDCMFGYVISSLAII